MHVEHKDNHEKLFGHENMGSFCQIQQLFWIVCSDEVLRLGLKTIFASLGLYLEGFRSRLGLKGHKSRSQAY